jgi:hypothetical protein
MGVRIRAVSLVPRLLVRLVFARTAAAELDDVAILRHVDL